MSGQYRESEIVWSVGVGSPHPGSLPEGEGETLPALIPNESFTTRKCLYFFPKNQTRR